MPAARPIRERFDEKWVESTEHFHDGTPCWDWTATKDRGGYGALAVNRVAVGAHRVAYQIFVGPIPEGMDLDHLCRRRNCVNWRHLEPVTHAENIRRGNTGKHWSDRTHCNHGHEFTSENTYIGTSGSGGPKRVCRACQAESSRKYKAKKSTIGAQ